MQAGSIDEALGWLDAECKKTITAFKRELQKIRTGRASSGMLESIHVDYYGSKTALNHLAQISSPEPRLLLVQVYDVGVIEAVDKAIRSSELGFNPSRDGNVLRINVPALTEETRKEIVRHLNKLAEEIRVSIRNHRREGNEALKTLEKEGTAAKDEVKRAMERVQKEIDGFIAEVDRLLAAKEAECMEV